MRDVVHGVDFFLGRRRESQSQSALDRATLAHIAALSKYLGHPTSRRHGEAATELPPWAGGWAATWRLSNGRTLTLDESMPFLHSDYFPTLSLTLRYSRLYAS